MKRELVLCLRTVALLAMFSQDPDTVANIQDCLESMSYMEPELILHPVLERAVPSLEALEEVCLPLLIGFALMILITELDPANDCRNKCIRCRRSRHCVSQCLLSRRKASRTNSAPPHSRN
jgi:Proteasome-substrate-size regulator, mid region